MAQELQALVGRRILEARKALGLTQEQFSALVGSPTRTVQSWEAGQRIPRSATMLRVAEETNRSVSWFYATDDEAVAA